MNVYYPNWSAGRLQVRDLPWDRLASVNHSFWRIEPNADFTKFPIVSLDEGLDFGEDGCFAQYAEMAALHPDVDILISVGGWVDTRWFSLMAGSRSGRASFVESCVEALAAHPFLGGIDIDWEYPGPSRNHLGGGYVGSSDDRDNFTALMREMREGFDAAGFNGKIITYCAPTSTGDFKAGQVCLDFAAIDPYVNRVNIMTYDMAGEWSERVMHHSALYPAAAVDPGSSAAEAVEYVLACGVQPAKIAIGSPLYSRGWVVAADSGRAALGMEIPPEARGDKKTGSFNWYELAKMEKMSAWEVLYDEAAEAAYMYNNDPASPHYRLFLTYESPRSLQAKLDYIKEKGLGGLIVWEATGDSADEGFPMLTRMADSLRGK